MSVTGGTLQVAAATGLGSGVATNTIALSGGGRLLSSATTDLTANRSIAVGSGGGVLAFSNVSAGTLTVPGAITGSDPLTFQNVAAGLGTFALTGNNTGFTGAMSVTALGTAAAVVTLAGQTSLPAAPSITLNYPANATASNTSNNLSFPAGVNLPATTTLNMTSFQLSPTVSLRSGVAITGASGTSNIDSPIRLSGSSVSQFTAAAGTTVNYTGGLAETTPGSYAEAPGVPNSNVVFFRGAGTHNYTTTAINLPSTGARIAVTDGAVLNLNTTGNTFASAASLFGTFRIGATNAVPTTTTLIIGQAGDQAATFDLNGFDQTISTLTYAAVTLNTTTRGISNSHASATSTFTVNQAADATFGGTLTGRINLVKGGANSLTLSATNSTFTGNVTVDNGSLIASAGSAGTNGVLGVVNQAGRTVTVNNTGTLSFTSNNIFGNGVGNANLPAVTVNAGGSLTSTRYNVLGPVTLNGGLLTQSSTDTGTFQGYQLRGDVTVGGSVASNISTGNGKGTHLGANTIFTVADVTGSAAADLTISTPLLDQSGDFASAAGGFTKDGPGTMTLSGTNTYTGPTTVNNGTLRLEAGSSIASSSLLTINSGGTLGGTGTTGALAVAAGGTINPGASPGILSTSGITTAGNVNIEIGGLTAGTGSGFHDQINTTGSLTLNGGLLVVSLVNTYVPNQNDFFDIWLNDGGDAILGSGTFTGMPEGFGDSGTWPVPETAAVEDYWSITYLGNTGNDIRLTYVPEPSSTLLAGAAGLLALSRRRRRTV